MNQMALSRTVVVCFQLPSPYCDCFKATIYITIHARKSCDLSVKAWILDPACEADMISDIVL